MRKTATIVALVAMLVAMLAILSGTGAAGQSVSVARYQYGGPSNAGGQNGRIVFQTNRDGNEEIYTMNADGTSRVNLTRHQGGDVDPHWSADGHRIVFASNRDDDSNFEIFTMNDDGSGVSQLTSTFDINRWPSWTNGGRILFHRGTFPNRDVYLMNADGTGEVNLSPGPQDSAWAAAAPRGPSIAFSRYTDAEGQRLYTMNTISGVTNLVTPAPRELADVQANWSPNGNDLVFVRLGDTGSELFVVHKDGTGLTQLTNTSGRLEGQPGFSPDGEKVVFAACRGRGTANQHCANYIMNTDGTGEMEVSTPRIPYLDTFSDTRIDPFWSSGTFNGTGPTITEASGRLEIDVPSSTENGPAGYATSDALSACRLTGDFDIQIDYELLAWPSLDLGVNGVNLNFGVNFTHTLFVHNASGTTGISTYFPDPAANVFAPFGDTSGGLRLVRSGETLTGYYRSGGSWIPLLSVPFTVPEAFVQLSIFTNDPPDSHDDIKVAFDNFRISSGAISCPSGWYDSAPDWQPIVE